MRVYNLAFKPKIFYWLPRILAILFIAFISIFALDVFNGPNWALALFVHLIPSYFLIAITTIAWKNETIGGCLFVIIGFFLLIFTHFEAYIIGIPAFVIGALFFGQRYIHKI